MDINAMKFVKLLRKGLMHLFLIANALVVGFPFFWMLSNSIKTKEEIWAIPPKFLPAVAQWVNYNETLADGTFARYVWNSTYTALILTAIVLINSSMFAYALTNIKFKGRNFLFLLIMVTYIMPSASTHIPSYITISRLHLMNTHTGLIISGAASIFDIFFFRQTFMQINLSILEAARIDGANHWDIFSRIVVPMSKSSFFTLGILAFIGAYNSYVWPSLIIRDKSKFLVSMGIRAFFQAEGSYGLKWGAIMAACCVVVAPMVLVFLVGQKWIIRGITSDSAVKG